MLYVRVAVFREHRASEPDNGTYRCRVSGCQHQTVDARFTTEDEEVYRFAEEEFARRYGAMVRVLAEGHLAQESLLADPLSEHSQEEISRLLDRYYRTHQDRFFRTRPHLVHCGDAGSLTLHMSQAIAGSGWHGREDVWTRRLVSGRWDTTASAARHLCRWTGPVVESSLDFVVERARAYRLSMTLLEVAHPDVFERLEMFANEAKLEIKNTRTDTSQYRIEAEIDAACVGADRVLRLGFVVPRTLPCGPRGDSRLRVWLRIQELQLTTSGHLDAAGQTAL